MYKTLGSTPNTTKYWVFKVLQYYKGSSRSACGACNKCLLTSPSNPVQKKRERDWTFSLKKNRWRSIGICSVITVDYCLMLDRSRENTGKIMVVFLLVLPSRDVRPVYGGWTMSAEGQGSEYLVLLQVVKASEKRLLTTHAFDATLRRQRQADLFEFQTRKTYIVKPCLKTATLP